MSETGVAAGVRRIEAITSDGLIEFYNKEVNKLDEISAMLKTTPEDVISKLDSILKENKTLKSELTSVKKQMSVAEIADIDTIKIKELNVSINVFKDKDNVEFKNLVDSIKEKIENYVVIAFSDNKDSVSIIVSMSDAAIKHGLHAGNILKELAKCLGGNGGGREKFAEGRGKDASKINDAVELSKKLVNV